MPAGQKKDKYSMQIGVSMKKYIHTIRAKILLCTISIMLSVSSITIVISYIIVSSNLRQNLIQTSETRLTFLCSSIDSNINGMKAILQSCQKNGSVRKFVMENSSNGNKTKREAHEFITEVCNANPSLVTKLIRLVIIGTSREDIIQVVQSTYSNTTVSSEKILMLPYFDDLCENSGTLSTPIMTDPFFNSKSIQMLPLVYLIEHPYKVGTIGYIFAEMSVSVITEPIHNYHSDTDRHFYFRIGDRLYQYNDQRLLLCEEEYEFLADLSDVALSSDTVVQKLKNKATQEICIMVTRPLANNGMYATEYLSVDLLSRNISHTFFLVVLIILTFAVVIGILLALFLSRTVNVPVKQLQARMKRIADGDFSRDPSTEWANELGDIGKSINDLSENVLSLMNQRLENERQKRDYEYRMLQSQINPHFLYNTLNSIKWMATIQNAPGIAEMTTALSRLLKEISKGTTNLVPLSRELALLKDYFTIQQYRYGGIITLSFEIEDEALTSCEILKFTLQPIVENAIFHGIEPKGCAGSITVSIYQDADTNVHIDVTDDGVGMDTEFAAHILEEEGSTRSSFFKEIGVSNVHKRLQYEFGNSYGLHMTSVLGKFTTVSILLPYRIAKEDTKNHD